MGGGRTEGRTADTASVEQRARDDGRLVGLVALAGGLVAVAAALLVLQPFGPAGIGSDSASSVLYFERIADGRVLERFLGTTPKPLLTLVYGVAHGTSGDWRSLAWLAIAAWAGGVAAAGLLVGRVAGAAGAAFAVAGLIASPQLFLDVSLAYAVSWALLFVAVAGLLVTNDRPRWTAAGLALAAGALARQEVFLLIGFVLVMLVLRVLADRRDTGRLRVPAEAGLVVALVALPLTGLHDWLLTGDPLYFLAVPTIGAEGRDVASAGAAVRRLVRDVQGQPVLAALAVAGGVLLLRRRAWALLAGVLVFGPGMAAFFTWVSLRGLVSLERYLAPLDLAIVVAAAVAMGLGVRATTGWIAVRGGTRAGALAASVPAALAVSAVATALALAASPSVGPLDAGLTARIRLDRAIAGDWETMLPSIRAALVERPALLEPVPPPDPRSKQVARPALLVSAGLLSRAGVDLGVTYDRCGRLEWFGATPDQLADAAGSLVYLDTRLAATATFEPGWLLVDGPTAAGPVTLVPLGGLEDRVRLLGVEPAAGARLARPADGGSARFAS